MATIAQQLAWKNWTGFNGLIIGFDDEYDSIWDAYLYMQARGLKGTVYVCTNNVDTAGYLTHGNLVTMGGNGWAIGNHTRDHAVLTGLSEADQEAELADAKTALDGWGLTQNSMHVAYPSGGWNANTLTAMANTGMLTGRTATPVVDTVDPRLVHPYVLNTTWLAAATATLADAQAAINAAKAKGNYSIIYFHRFVVAGPGGNQWTYANFYALIDWIIEQGLPTSTIGQFYAQIVR